MVEWPSSAAQVELLYNLLFKILIVVILFLQDLQTFPSIKTFSISFRVNLKRHSKHLMNFSENTPRVPELNMEKHRQVQLDIEHVIPFFSSAVERLLQDLMFFPVACINMLLYANHQNT